MSPQQLHVRFVSVYEVSDGEAETILKTSASQPAPSVAPNVASSDGVVRIRGLPFSSNEYDIQTFFSGKLSWSLARSSLLLLLP